MMAMIIQMFFHCMAPNIFKDTDSKNNIDAQLEKHLDPVKIYINVVERTSEGFCSYETAGKKTTNQKRQLSLC